MSTNSSAWMRFTTLEGTGGKLVASVNGVGGGPAVADVNGTLGDHTVVVGGIRLLAVDNTDRTGAFPVADRSGIAVIDTGSDVRAGGAAADVAGPPVTWGKRAR